MGELININLQNVKKFSRTIKLFHVLGYEKGESVYIDLSDGNLYFKEYHTGSIQGKLKLNISKNYDLGFWVDMNTFLKLSEVYTSIQVDVESLKFYNNKDIFTLNVIKDTDDSWVKTQNSIIQTIEIDSELGKKLKTAIKFIGEHYPNIYIKGGYIMASDKTIYYVSKLEEMHNYHLIFPETVFKCYNSVTVPSKICLTDEDCYYNYFLLGDNNELQIMYIKPQNDDFMYVDFSGNDISNKFISNEYFCLNKEEFNQTLSLIKDFIVIRDNENETITFDVNDNQFKIENIVRQLTKNVAKKYLNVTNKEMVKEIGKEFLVSRRALQECVNIINDNDVKIFVNSDSAAVGITGYENDDTLFGLMRYYQ